MMNATVTRFMDEKAGVFQNGNLKAFDLVPEEKELDLVFHAVRLKAQAITEPEENDVDKTFLIMKGSGLVKVGEHSLHIQPGDAVWFPKGSVHVIENGPEELQFVVVKTKGD